MNNISIATFKCGSKSCELYGLWQYDYGQILRIQDLGLPPAVEIHFSLTEKGGTSVTRVGTTKDGVTDVVIPDSLLENDDASQDYWIYAFVYLTDDDSGSTEYKIAMKVKSRPRPEAIDRPGDQELFREAIAAVNEAAERAENAVNNLNADVSEKVTRPDTAEVGQALVVKEIDETGKPITFEAQDMVEVPKWAQKPEKPTYTAKEVGALPDDTKIPTKVSELENDKSYLTEPYDDTELKSEIATKITAPENPEVGKVFRIKTVNEDGTFIGEWADGGVANLDVQINGKSIVQDGVAEIPLCTKANTAGLIYIDQYSNAGGLYKANTATGLIRIAKATDSALTERANQYCPVVPANLDYAVKAAMCDGKGAAWTSDEKAAARERMGAYRRDYRLIADITLEQESSRLIVEKDADGKNISLRKAKIFVFSPVPRENSKNNGYVQLNDKGIYYGAIDWKVDGKNSVTVVNIDIFGEMAPTTVEFVPAHNIGIASTKTICMSVGSKLDYNNEINKITILSNYYFDKGTRFIIIGKE